VTGRALPCPVEVRPARLGIAGEQPLRRIIVAHVRAAQRFAKAKVQERDYILSRGIGHRERRHPFIRPAVANDGPDQVTAGIAIHQGRAHQVRPSRPRGVCAMAKTAGLHECLLAALGRLRVSRRGDNQADEMAYQIPMVPQSAVPADGVN
jgi:hypothetical protein